MIGAIIGTRMGPSKIAFGDGQETIPPFFSGVSLARLDAVDRHFSDLAPAESPAMF